MKTNPQPGAAVSAPTALPWIVTQSSAGTLDICHEANGARSRIARLHCELLAPEHGGSIAGNAGLICRAVNNHDRLVAALRELIETPDVHSEDMAEARATLAAATLSRPPTATPERCGG